MVYRGRRIIPNATVPAFGMSGRAKTAGDFFPPAVLPTAAALFLLGGIGANSLLALAATLALIIGSALLWRPGEPPILLFIFGYQWLQSSIAIFHANRFGKTVSELSAYGGNLQLAIILSLLGLLALTVGMRLGAGRWRPGVAQLARNTALQNDTTRWFYMYGVAILLASLARSFAWVIPGFSQPLLALANIKWAFFFALTYVTFVKPGTSRIFWMLAFGLELALSLGGYFSEFKTVFLISLLAMVMAGVRLSPRQIVGAAFLGAVMVALVIVWTAIKMDYRSFVSGGQHAQIVTVDYTTRIGKLIELASELDHDKLANGTEQLLERLAYIEFFGVVLETVPDTLPHEWGALWWDAITRPFMPRLFFPWKTEIHDSDRTNYYTGLGVAGVDSGTSISIGIMSESYIDFGEYGMMLVLLTYGAAIGRIYRWMIFSRNARGLLGSSLATATLFGAAALESSITKVIGGVVVTFLVAFVLIQFIVPRYLRWLRV